jgi:hypothetical protein
VLAGPGSGAVPATVTGGLGNTLWVTPTGSDTAGNGTFYSPYATIAKATTEAMGATQANPSTILCGPGTYSENVLLKPNVGVVGLDFVAVSINGTVTLDASWTGAAAGDIGACVNLVVDDDVTLTFPAANGDIVFQNVSFGGNVTATGGPGSNPLGNSLSLFDVFVVGTTSATGVALVSELATLDALALASTASLECTWDSNGDTVTGSHTITGAAQACLATLTGTTVSGSLALSGSTVVYTTTADGIPATVTRTGGAPAPVLTTLSSGTNYTPTTPSNWVSPAPTTVQQALDRIAANTANAHPIP